MCLSKLKPQEERKWKFQQIPTILLPKFSLQSNYKNEYPHFWSGLKEVNE